MESHPANGVAAIGGNALHNLIIAMVLTAETSSTPLKTELPVRQQRGGENAKYSVTHGGLHRLQWSRLS